ncbi:MAG: PEP-CTERM system histidine kinase PrsK [Gammaproteobacteria bacterium]|nr:MAG: PEP-CTERM system histidine kinase PrsK [Gammaproteobacteria bacterium]
MSTAVVSFASGALAWLVTGLLLLTGRPRPRKRRLAAVSGITALWLAFSAWHASGRALFLPTQLLELSRDYAWLLLLCFMLSPALEEGEHARARYRRFLVQCSAFLLFLVSLTLYRFYLGHPILVLDSIDVYIAGYLTVSLLGLVLVEHIWRNTRREARRSMRYFCLGVGSLFAYDFYLYSNALLFQGIDPVLWQARGFVHVLAIPPLAVAVMRDRGGRIDIFVSRRMVFHTLTLLAAGIYLLAMGAGGYYVRNLGGTWGTVAQVAFLFGAMLVLGLLFVSEKVRAYLRVFINKHFFHYKYDYREEWLRFIGMLSTQSDEQTLRESVVRGIAEVIGSKGGALWWRVDGRRFAPVAFWNLKVPEGAVVDTADELAEFLGAEEWVINLEEYRRRPELYRDLRLPEWLERIPRAALVVPLMLRDDLHGFVVLDATPALKTFNWEDCDLLRTLGREAASHLAQLEASRALAEARQFETFSRMSTYVVHDLKNLIGQLSLVVTNAERHRGNPEFMEDAIRTVAHSVEKMNRLLNHLRGGVADREAKGTVELCALLEDVARTMRNGRPLPEVDCQVRNQRVRANPDRLAAVIGHVVRNAQDATPDDGRIVMRLFKQGGEAVIEVQDTGCGMTEEFIRERLFRPFDTTKGTAGMGVGAHEVREFVESLGGRVEVLSRVGEGTTFRIRLPVSDERENRVQLQVVDGSRTGNGNQERQEIAGRRG